MPGAVGERRWDELLISIDSPNKTTPRPAHVAKININGGVLDVPPGSNRNAGPSVCPREAPKV
jgi:hypothetical protein